MKTKMGRRKIKNVEDCGKPDIVFSTNCEFFFSFHPTLHLFSHSLVCVKMHKMSSTCWRVAKNRKKKNKRAKT